MSCLLPSLKLECEKLASEKTEMQRHYVMVSGPAGQGSAGQGLALSGNTWTANLNSVCHSGVGPRSFRGLVVPLCKMGWLGFQVFLPGPSQLLRTMREGCPLPSWASLRVQGLWALPPAPPPWREWRGALLPPRGSQGLGQSVPCRDPPAWGLLEDPESPGAGLDIRQCRGHSCPPFPLQYYEMSYGLNVEMHKQVTVSG